MNQQNLESLIDQLQEGTDFKNATFGIYFGLSPEESYIKANPQGLQSFAAELLKASKVSLEQALEAEPAALAIESDAAWLQEDSDVLIQYVQPLSEEGGASDLPSQSQSGREKVTIGLLIAALLLILASVVVGLITIGGWIF